MRLPEVTGRGGRSRAYRGQPADSGASRHTPGSRAASHTTPHGYRRWTRIVGTATVAEFTAPAAELPLGSVFETLPDATVELERLVPQENRAIPYFWLRNGGPADVEATFQPHPGLTGVRLVDSVDLVPIHETLDTDSLDALVGRQGVDGVRVSWVQEGHVVTVEERGVVTVAPS